MTVQKKRFLAFIIYAVVTCGALVWVDLLSSSRHRYLPVLIITVGLVSFGCYNAALQRRSQHGAH